MNETQYKTDVFNAPPASAVEVVDGVLEYAVSLQASDVHIDPRLFDVSLRLRIDGELEFVGTLPLVMHEEVISRLKILSGARTDIHAVPQDGRFRSTVKGELYNLRVSFMPTFHGENAVIRLLPASHKKHDSFASLGFTPEHVETITQALSSPNGLILVTGPTGCGKTTTLRVCLGLKSSQPISVMTLEDPVEYEVPGVRHVHIRESFGVSFASGLRAALRQDPDVIMLGEIRDDETAKTAVQTALTGHLVLSTLHTTSALDAIVRLSNMGVERYLIAATLKLVVSQRLVRTLCHECNGNSDMCRMCRGTGFRGRSVIAEIITIDQRLRELIEKGSEQKGIQDYVQSQGFRTLKEDAHEKIDWGVTTNEEVTKALHS